MHASLCPRWLLALALALVLLPAPASATDAPSSTETDARTKALIERRLSRDDLFAYHRLDVQVSEGVALLTGPVRTRQTRDAVLREIKKIPGVRSVQARMKVEPNP